MMDSSRLIAVVVIAACMVLLGCVWLYSDHSKRSGREGLNKQESQDLAEQTKDQKEEAVHAAGKYETDRSTARSHAKVMTELLNTLDAELVAEMLDYAKNRHDQGNSYALMTKHAANTQSINALRESSETVLKILQAV